MKRFLCAVLLAPLVASADEIIVHVGSYHQDDSYYHDGSQGTYNNFNPGIGYLTDSCWTIGMYKNSYKELSVYAGKSWLWNCGITGLKCGGMLGVASGYRKYLGHPVQPMGGLVLKYDINEQYGVMLLGYPPAGDVEGLVHLALTIKAKGF
jgi:hypothetical protein